MKTRSSSDNHFRDIGSIANEIFDGKPGGCFPTRSPRCFAQGDNFNEQFIQIPLNRSHVHWNLSPDGRCMLISIFKLKQIEIIRLKGAERAGVKKS